MNNSHIPQYKYQLANPLNILAKDIKQAPLIGQKIVVIRFYQFSNKEARKLLKLNDTVTVKDINPILVGDNGNYHYEYEIEIAEFPDILLLGWDYKVK